MYLHPANRFDMPQLNKLPSSDWQVLIYLPYIIQDEDGHGELRPLLIPFNASGLYETRCSKPEWLVPRFEKADCTTEGDVCQKDNEAVDNRRLLYRWSRSRCPQMID